MYIYSKDDHNVQKTKRQLPTQIQTLCQLEQRWLVTCVFGRCATGLVRAVRIYLWFNCSVQPFICEVLKLICSFNSLVVDCLCIEVFLFFLVPYPLCSLIYCDLFHVMSSYSAPITPLTETQLLHEEKEFQQRQLEYEWIKRNAPVIVQVGANRNARQ